MMNTSTANVPSRSKKQSQTLRNAGMWPYKLFKEVRKEKR